MTKLSVLLSFSQANGFLTPDYVCRILQPSPDRRSLYSYLARLKRQGLLERGPNPRRGRLSYRLTKRGAERIAYLKTKEAPARSTPMRPVNAVQKPPTGFRHNY